MAPLTTWPEGHAPFDCSFQCPEHVRPDELEDAEGFEVDPVATGTEQQDAYVLTGIVPPLVAKLHRAARAVDALWDEPDDPEDAAEGKIWLADYEEDGIPVSFADALRGLRDALGTPSSGAVGPAKVHEPGDSHDYRIECTTCGERGVIRLSVNPERAP